MDESFYNSVHHQLINDLVGDQPVSANASLIAIRKPHLEDIKNPESGANTTNHSTGDSQGSSSAEKVERRCSALNEVDVEEASNSSSSSSEEKEGFGVLNESLRSFITDSPFSFKNPIFFSVPRD